MDILSQKREIHGKIAADKTLVSGLPQLRTTSSMQSINNDDDPIAFLTDLLKSLVGSESLEDILVDTLIYSINDIEQEIKKELKLELKSIVSCGVNPSIPQYLKTSGINFRVNQVDYFGTMFVNPISAIGQLIFSDITPNLIDSTDFNTFLYQTIQNDGSTQVWPQYAGSTTPILDFKFDAVDVAQINPNNTITIKVNQNFDGTLTDLNNQFIDSIKIFNTEKIVSQVVDLVFGTVSKNNKSLKQLEFEEEINTVINKILKTDSNTIVSDNTFVLSNEERKFNEYNAKMRKKGEKIFDTSTKNTSSISLDSLKEMNTNISSTNNPETKKSELKKSIKKMSSEITSSIPDNSDKKSVELGFIQDLISFLTRSIVMGILSPKIITIFLINFKLIYGQNATFDDPIDFLRKNRNLIRSVSKSISNIIISALLRAVLKEITQLVGDAIKKRLEDKAKSNLKQLLSLFGVPQEQIQKIRNL